MWKNIELSYDDKREFVKKIKSISIFNNIENINQIPHDCAEVLMYWDRRFKDNVEIFVEDFHIDLVKENETSYFLFYDDASGKQGIDIHSKVVNKRRGCVQWRNDKHSSVTYYVDRDRIEEIIK